MIEYELNQLINPKEDMVKTLLDLSVYISDETERRDKPQIIDRMLHDGQQVDYALLVDCYRALS